MTKAFITVQELLKLVDLDAIVRKTIESDNVLSVHDYGKISRSWSDFLSRMASYSYVKSDDIAVFSSVWDNWDGEVDEYIDVCLYKRDELSKYCTAIAKRSFHSFDNLKNLPTDEIKRYIREINEGRPEGYAFEFNLWSEILGYQVSVGNLQRIGLQDCIFAMLEEMTFNGMTEESQKEHRQELDASIKEIEEIEKMPLEEQKKFFHDYEDLRKELGVSEDTRSEEEKEEEDRSFALYHALTANAVISELRTVGEEIGSVCK
ncbi:hypothetical protein D081_1035 [Anaerovibrio sp. JC8]|uniref:DUF6557 family protein n=1 Tax=Anaerovibrio sp. JC8 TaxID=1240085 RepID=UPI000A0EA2CA|nr:DUF6557 family protein [Anaerovibrio sp. JC8]ORU00512.1 hypothetical protein D081_1035 [Anaerovibrio sp. JC8]